jgi:Lrp/AsnC family leucine-responsive transcriptional regulator
VLKATVPEPKALAAIVRTIGGYGAVTTSVVLKSEPSEPSGRTFIMAPGR